MGYTRRKTKAELAADLDLNERNQDLKNLVANLPGFALAKFTYDFAVNGGAISTITLTGDELPARAIVFGGLMEVITAPTGASGNGAIQLVAANDIVTAAVIAGAPWSTTGRKAIIPVFSAATAVKTTSPGAPALVISAGAFTAGKFNLFLAYVVADAA